jgi:hypothetical protein
MSVAHSAVKGLGRTVAKVEAVDRVAVLDVASPPAIHAAKAAIDGIDGAVPMRFEHLNLQGILGQVLPADRMVENKKRTLTAGNNLRIHHLVPRFSAYYKGK